MLKQTADLRIANLRPLIAPAILVEEELPVTERASETVTRARQEAAAIVAGQDDRLLVVVGPCSIHDTEAAIEYAGLLSRCAERLCGDLCVIMRVYFEKPRTVVGWKGLINDPCLNDSFAINQGLRRARRLLLDLGNMGVPAGSEFLDTISPQFTADLVSWGAIGARTTESQVHRELASGLSMPVGFKNGTDGNSRKNHANQPAVAQSLAEQVSAGSSAVFGLMMESHLVGGNQPLGDDPQSLTCGQSITDACMSWDTTEPVLENLARACRRRRQRK